MAREIYADKIVNRRKFSEPRFVYSCGFVLCRPYQHFEQLRLLHHFLDRNWFHHIAIAQMERVVC